MSARVEVRELPVLDGTDRSYEVSVPTEHGRLCIVDVAHHSFKDSYAVEFSGELLDQAPEAVTAAVQMAMLAVADMRRSES